jgi:hypothetical protein
MHDKVTRSSFLRRFAALYLDVKMTSAGQEEGSVEYLCHRLCYSMMKTDRVHISIACPSVLEQLHENNERVNLTSPLVIITMFA